MGIFNSIADRVLDVPHRQWVFTIPASLRYLFRTDRSRRLSLIFDAAAETIRHAFYSINPVLDTIPGFIIVCHTSPSTFELIQSNDPLYGSTMLRWIVDVSV